MITDKDIERYWAKYDWFIIKWNLVSFFGLILIFPIPVSYALKYWFNVKGLWLLNDTEDGDFGSYNELKNAGRLDKSKWANFWWWWFRNHSWNFNRKYIPNWNNGTAEFFIIISTSLTKEQIARNRWTWCSKDGIHGHHYIAAIIDGKLECRFSEADDKMQRQMGSGGNEYRFRFKGMPQIIINSIKRLV